MLNVCFIGTCQIKAIADILSQHSEFAQKYTIKNIIEVHKATDESIEKMFKDENMQLFICQPISTNYRKGIISTKRLLENFNSKIIMIPFIYFDGYFPAISYLYDEEGKKIEKYGLNYFDKNVLAHVLENVNFNKVENYLVENHNMDEILEKVENKLNSVNYYGKNFCLRHVEASLKRLEIREMYPYDYPKPVDVKISDYIRENYINKRLFYTMNHPTDDILYETTNRIMKLLNLNFVKFVKKDFLKDIVFPIYPCVKHNLDLKFDTTWSKISKLKPITDFNETLKIFTSIYFSEIKIKNLIKNFI